MAKDVLCEVTNCHFWESGNQCGAEEIKVVTRKGKSKRLRRNRLSDLYSKRMTTY
ncbi:DUF1540 domain-containing protein [Sporosarcina newyorkensis]